MSRFLSFSLLVTLLAGAGIGRAQTTVDYFLPVTYDMVISRSIAGSGRTELSYEVFSSKDLLRSILKANGVTSAANWTLVAQGSATPLTDSSESRATDTLSSLRIVARHAKTGAIKEPTEAIALSLAPTSDLAALQRTERQTAGSAVVSSSTHLSRLAQFTQKLVARGNLPAGTLSVTGLISYANVYNKVSANGETSSAAVLRPTSGTFQASGQFTEDGGTGTDGLVELRIVFGTPSYSITEEVTD